MVVFLGYQNKLKLLDLNKQIEVKRKIKQLFDDGINKNNVFELIESELNKQTFHKFTHQIANKNYCQTENAFESNLMLWKRSNSNTFIFDKFLIEVK